MGVVMAGLMCAGCASGNATGGVAGGSVNEAPVSFTADSANVKALGRTMFSDGVLWLGYSSTGAAFNIEAKRLDVTFAGDSAARVRSAENQTGLARVAVFVNGERKLDELLLKQEQTYTVFDGNETVTGEVLVLKISEAANSMAGIKSISVSEGGTITPAPAKDRRIEFIGDSITCGYGVDDEDRDHHFSTATEDSTKSYAYKTAQILNADYSTVSESGWGIISGYTNDPAVKSDKQLIPTYYDKLAFCYNYFGDNQAQNIDWDFSLFVPDVVVINLGTNDDSYCKGDPDKVAEFTTAYEAFIKDIRSKNPDSYILCTLGIMGDALFGAIQNAVDSYKSETGDARVDTLHFTTQLASDGWAADWHPTETTHEKASQVLAAKISEVMGWD